MQGGGDYAEIDGGGREMALAGMELMPDTWIEALKCSIRRVNTILGNPSYRKAAQQKALEINEYDAIKNFKAFIDEWDQGKIKRRL